MNRWVKPLVRLALILITVTVATFVLMRVLPGDPALIMLGENATQERLVALRAELGLGDPLLVQYWDWVSGLVGGDLGSSYFTRRPVIDMILDRLPVTLELGFLAITIALIGAIPVAILSAFRQNSALDRGFTTMSFAIVSIPSFVSALVLILIFAVAAQWLPATGWTSFTEDPLDNVRHVALPALALAMVEFPIYARVLRADLISVLADDFVTLARSKGVPTWRVLTFHALRPASLSLVTIVGLNVGAVLGGTVIIETIFALPGVGRMLLDSILRRDLPVVQGVVVFIAFSYVIANAVVDLLYAVLDPRIRRGAAPARRGTPKDDFESQSL